MADYIPGSDAEFNLWQSSLVTLVQTNATAWGIAEDDITSLATQQTNWAAAFAKASNKQNRTSADVQAKDDARHSIEAALRQFVAQWLTNNTRVTNADRDRMGLTVKSNGHTPSAVPATSPTGHIDFSVRLQHTIAYSDEATPHSKAKPDGVHGCEIWAKTGTEAPKDNAEFAFLGTSTATPYVVNFASADAGKTAYYRLRWVNTRGQQGPWSGVVSAMVVG